MKCDKNSLLLYAVTDRSWLNGTTLDKQVEQALRGGATFVQLREKDLDKEAFVQEAIKIKALCKQYQVPFVINDCVDIALAVDADGVHVGQNDMKVAEARAKLGPNKIIGVSAKTVEQALEAEANGANYIGVGAVFPTGTKKDATEVSHKSLKEICEAVHIPVVAIGGIEEGNVMQLSGSKVCGVAVVSAIFAQPDIERATCNLKKRVQKMVLEQ